MAKFSAIVCDHCDARDVLEQPPVHKITAVTVVIRVDGDLTRDLKADLCDRCIQALDTELFRLMTQQPRESDVRRA